MLIMETKFGSHLYGTNTCDSDTDYKGIYIPTKDDILLGRIKHSLSHSSKNTKEEGIKNTKDDIDIEYYSIHRFIQLASLGRMDAFDMLHAPTNMLEVSHPIWEEIVRNREKFYTKNLNSFVDYVRKQAYKYGIKGSRMAALYEVIQLLRKAETMNFGKHADCVWFQLPQNEHCYYLENGPHNIRQYKVCGKILQNTMSIKHALKFLNNMYTKYGTRTEAAKRNQGIDWKAISHAFRAAYQTKQIFLEKTITFPLPMADLLIQIKQGKLDFEKELEPRLEAMIEELDEMSKTVDLPDEVDKVFWDDFLIRSISNHYKWRI